MNGKIKEEVERRGISRLCHFTPSRNLGQILSGTFGVLATRNLEKDERHISLRQPICKGLIGIRTISLVRLNTQMLGISTKQGRGRLCFEIG